MDIDTILKKVFRRNFVRRILCHYNKYHRQKIKEELLTKIQKAKYDYLITGLNYHFDFYKAEPFPTPWEAKTFQLRFERTDKDMYRRPLDPGHHNIKINVGPAYFFISDHLFYR